MNTQYDLAIESFIMNFDENIMNDMIAEEGLKDAMVKVKNAILAAIRWIVDKCKLLFRKITGKDKSEVGKIMKETQKIQKVVEKTNNPQVLSQAQEKVKEQKAKLEEVTGGGEDASGDTIKGVLSEKQKSEHVRVFRYIDEELRDAVQSASHLNIPKNGVEDVKALINGNGKCDTIKQCLNNVNNCVTKSHNVLNRDSDLFSIGRDHALEYVNILQDTVEKERARVNDYRNSIDGTATRRYADKISRSLLQISNMAKLVIDHL